MGRARGCDARGLTRGGKPGGEEREGQERYLRLHVDAAARRAQAGIQRLRVYPGKALHPERGAAALPVPRHRREGRERLRHDDRGHQRAQGVPRRHGHAQALHGGRQRLRGSACLLVPRRRPDARAVDAGAGTGRGNPSDGPALRHAGDRGRGAHPAGAGDVELEGRRKSP